MDKIEIGRAPANLLQHCDVQGTRVAYRSVESQCLRPHWLKFCRSPGVTAGKQGDIVSARGELFGEPINDPLSATVQLGWNGFRQRRDLGYAHGDFPFRTM